MTDQRWTIKVEYLSGDSYGTWIASDEIPITWENFDKAKEALARIEEFYYSHKYEDSPSIWELGHPDEPRPKPLNETAGWVPEVGNYHSIRLQLDDGTEQPISAFWMGYFESLIEARIIVATELQDEETVFRP